MSNLDIAPMELRCERVAPDAPGRAAIEVLAPREVPLGGPRAMLVRRTLPQRQRSLIGAWCFADHYGPDDVSVTGGMDVAPHPHTGLQTVSWLFTGEIEHRDSNGIHALVRPGEINLMTGGHGICHSEVSSPVLAQSSPSEPATTILHGVQLWVALPDESRDAARDFQHYAPPRVHLDEVTVRVFLGTLAGQISPVHTFSPLLGAELTLDPRGRFTLDIDPSFEHGLLVDAGTIAVDDTEIPHTALGYVPTGRTAMSLTNLTDAPARGLLLGGEPFREEIVMWWNFVGRSHDEIVAYRQAWQQESDRVGRVEGYQGRLQRLPAPPLPTTRIRPRRHPG